jgi:hypothetical protein
MVLLGGETAIGGSGQIVELTFRLLKPDDLSLSFDTIVMRDGQNNPLPAAGNGWEYGQRAELPAEYKLNQNYPNPFNLQAIISYQMPEPGFVKIKIYNIRGQAVRTLVDEHRPAGYHCDVWDGKNNAGQEIASGIYTYRMEANGYSATRKMLLIK